MMPGLMWRILVSFLTSNGCSEISVAGMTVPSGKINCLWDGLPMC